MGQRVRLLADQQWADSEQSAELATVCLHAAGPQSATRKGTLPPVQVTTEKRRDKVWAAGV